MSTHITLIYATETGNAEALARRAAEKLNTLGYATSLLNAEHTKPVVLSCASLLLLFTSTWGSGEPPTSAQDFHDALLGADMSPLPNLRYAVFGLGDTSYGDDFCACARRLDSRLEELGAIRIHECGEADVDFDAPYEAWIEGAIAAIEHVQSAAT